LTEHDESQARWREYVRTRCPKLREAIIRDYAVLARRAVDRLQISPWGCVSQEDLISHAVIGLIDAVDRYDPDYGPPFEGFAMPRIRGAILDALRQLDWVPRSVRVKEQKLRLAFGKLEGLLGRPPRDEEVAAELGIDLAELEQLVTDVARGSVLSLDDLVAAHPGGTRRDAGGGEGATLGEVTPSGDSHDPYRSQERSEAHRRLAEAIDALPEREKLVVSLYYYHELTLKEIGKVLDVTEQRVSQIHAKAMLRLSHKLIRHSELMASLAA
jgi:RNA polymerase sigma factor for flagellar operon FliA